MTGGRLAGVALGLVLLTSGVLKAADERWPEQGLAFGVPWTILRLVVPAELVLGAMLVAGLGGAVPAVVATALLVGFTVVVVGHLRRDGADAPVCACFGGLSRGPISWRTVARNVGFVVLGVVAAIG